MLEFVFFQSLFFVPQALHFTQLFPSLISCNPPKELHQQIKIKIKNGHEMINRRGESKTYTVVLC